MRKLLLIIATLGLSMSVYAQDTVSNDILTVVTSHDELDFSDVDLIAIPTHGPYMLTKSGLSSLIGDDEILEMIFPDDMTVDNVIWTGDDFVIKSGRELFMLAKLSESVIDFDIADYEIYPKDLRRIYVVSHQDSTSSLFLSNLKVHRAKRLLTIPENIIYVAPLGDATIVVTSGNIYMFNDEGCIRYLNGWSPIRTAVMTDYGLMFATENEVCLLAGVDRFALLFEAQARKLLYDSRYLYILLSAGDLVRYEI